MKIKCMICDRVNEVEDQSLLAKKMRNKPLTSYICTECHDRVAENTKAHMPKKEELLALEDTMDPVEH